MKAVARKLNEATTRRWFVVGGSGGAKKGRCLATPKEQFKTMQKSHAVWKIGALADVGVHSNPFQ